jgi:hypothetical protein
MLIRHVEVTLYGEGWTLLAPKSAIGSDIVVRPSTHILTAFHNYHQNFGLGDQKNRGFDYQ